MLFLSEIINFTSVEAYLNEFDERWKRYSYIFVHLLHRMDTVHPRMVIDVKKKKTVQCQKFSEPFLDHYRELRGYTYKLTVSNFF